MPTSNSNSNDDHLNSNTAPKAYFPRLQKILGNLLDLKAPVKPKNEPTLSARCLNPDPQKKYAKKDSNKKRAKYQRWLEKQNARYDDAATFALRQAITKKFIELNRDPLSEIWTSPSSAELLSAIHYEMNNQAVSGGGLFADLLSEKNASLRVAIVGDIEELTTLKIKVKNYASAFGGKTIQYKSVPPILSENNNTTNNDLLLTTDRWRIGRRKCSTPKAVVRPPYLIIAAIDNVSGLTLRARIFPVWTPADLSTFSIVRSSYERTAMDAIHDNGGVALTPIHKEQLAQLQAGLGHRWEGNLTTYPCLPDIIIPPKQGSKIAVLEVYGLCGYKKYDKGKKVKRLKIEKAQRHNHFTYLAIGSYQFRLHSVPQEAISEAITEFYNNASNTLWQP